MSTLAPPPIPARPPHATTPTQRHSGRSVTRLGWWVMGIAAVLAGLGLLRGDVWLYLLALLALAAVTVSWFALPRLSAVLVTLVLPELETVGQPTHVRVVVGSVADGVPRHRLSVLMAHARGIGGTAAAHAVVEARPAGGAQSIDVVLYPQVRGAHSGLITVHETGGPFGLVRRQHVLEHPITRTVVAGIGTASSPVAHLGGDGTDGPMTISRSGSELHGLRAWSPGDGTAIHWRTTARRGVPVVVDRETYQRMALVVVVGPGVGAESLDAVVADAAGIALAAAREGAEVHLVSSRGIEQVRADEADALLRWTSTADAAPLDPNLAEEVAALAGARGRMVVVHGRGARMSGWREAVARHGVEVLERAVDPRPVEVVAAPVTSGITRSLALPVLASLAGGLLCLTVTGVLSGPQAVLALGCLSVAGVLGLLRPATFAHRILRSTTSIAVAVGGATLAYRLLDDTDTDIAAAAAVALCGVAAAQLISSRTRRDGLVALGLGPVMVVVAVGFNPSPSVVVPTLLVTVAVLLALAACARAALDEGTPTASPSTGLAVPIAATVVLGVVSFLVLPLGSAPALGTSLLGERARAQSPAEQDSPLPPAYFGEAMDLSARGHLPDTTAFTVAPGAPPLWRAQTLDRVTNGLWYVRGEPALLTPDDGRITLPADPADAGSPTATSRRFTVRPTRFGLLVAPGPAASVTGEVSLVQQQQPTAFVLDTGGRPYDVTATTREDVDALTRSGTGADRTESTYVTADPTTTARTQQLARQIAAGTTDRVDTVHAVEDWLRANVRYQLDAPLPGENPDAVDFLLFDSRRGFCEHFAAAEAILLRSLGIPARLATGYAVTDHVVDASGWNVVRDSDAHAWVEVWIRGHGWVSSDPTAGAALSDADTDANLVQRALNGWNSVWANDSGRRLLAFMVLASVVVGALAMLALRRRRRLPGVRRAAADRTAALEPLAAFGRLRSALVASGCGFEPSDGVEEVRRAAAGDAALLGALDVVERTLYASTMPPSHVRLATAELLDARTARLLATV